MTEYKKKGKYLVKIRKFLNEDDNTSAHIIASVEIDQSDWNEVHKKLIEEDLYINVYTTLEIADCTRKISLDVDVEADEEEFYKHINKIDILIDTLKSFRAGAIAARVFYNEANKRYNEITKEIEKNKENDSSKQDDITNCLNH